jgi:hypothetical protein
MYGNLNQKLISKNGKQNNRTRLLFGPGPSAAGLAHQPMWLGQPMPRPWHGHRAGRRLPSALQRLDDGLVLLVSTREALGWCRARRRTERLTEVVRRR